MSAELAHWLMHSVFIDSQWTIFAPSLIRFQFFQYIWVLVGSQFTFDILKKKPTRHITIPASSCPLQHSVLSWRWAWPPLYPCLVLVWLCCCQSSFCNTWIPESKRPRELGKGIWARNIMAWGWRAFCFGAFCIPGWFQSFWLWCSSLPFYTLGLFLYPNFLRTLD